jgi:hypothetical protein
LVSNVRPSAYVRLMQPSNRNLTSLKIRKAALIGGFLQFSRMIIAVS